MILGLHDLIYAVSKVRVILEDGTSKSKVQSSGTVFFVLKNGKEFLITNRHVVDPERINGLKGKGFELSQLFVDRRVFDERTLSTKTEELLVKSCCLTYPDNDCDDIACISDFGYEKEPTIGYTRIDVELFALQEMFYSSISICDMLAFYWILRSI